MNDDNKSLWGGWAVVGPKHKFYYSGDTGYCPVFRDIGRIYGPFDACALPIGAYEPRWFMRAQHINPEEAVKIHQDVKSKFTVAIHWGTFALANEVGHCHHKFLVLMSLFFSTILIHPLNFEKRWTRKDYHWNHSLHLNMEKQG